MPMSMSLRAQRSGEHSSTPVRPACRSSAATCIDSLYESFANACAEKTKQLRIGNGMDAHTDVGPMIQERQVRIVEAHVEDAKARGARVLAGGKRLPELGVNFYAPTVLAGVTQDMRIMREETFGPVLPVMAVRPTMTKPCGWPTIPNTDWRRAFGPAMRSAASAWHAASMRVPSW